MPQPKCLWKRPARIVGSESDDESYTTIFNRFASRPKAKSLSHLICDSHVIVQELLVTSYFMARYHSAVQHEEKRSHGFDHFEDLDASTWVMILALFVAVVYSLLAEGSSKALAIYDRQKRSIKARQRVTDASLLAFLLRLFASILRSLTASYSSDTVQALASAGMLLHLLLCDYSYANGKIAAPSGHSSGYHHPLDAYHRPPFRGGAVSLNAALFSTTLLISRLQSNVQAYLIMLLAVVLFGIYPHTRHVICVAYPSHSSVAMWLISALVATATTLQIQNVESEGAMTVALIASCCLIGILLPCWTFVAQKSKIYLRGPWDLPTKKSMQLDYADHDASQS